MTDVMWKAKSLVLRLKQVGWALRNMLTNTRYRNGIKKLRTEDASKLDVSVNAQRLQKSAPVRECYFAIQKKRMSCPHVPNGQLSCLLHIYILSRIQWTWFGMIQSGSVCSIMFTKSKTQKKTATLYPWASQNVPNGQ